MKLIATSSIASFLLGTALLSGCTQQQPMTTDQALRPSANENIPVPPGSQLIAFGHYPLAPFVLPREGGMIYVYDSDTNRVAFVTTYPPDSNNTPGDLSQLSKSSFDPTHNYRVYYLSPQSMASTRPAGSGQY